MRTRLLRTGGTPPRWKKGCGTRRRRFAPGLIWSDFSKVRFRRLTFAGPLLRPSGRGPVRQE